MKTIDINAVNALLAGTSVAPIALPKPKAARKPKAVKLSDHDAKMATLKASSGQMRRINVEYSKAGLRTFTTLASFRKVFPTMLAASQEYRSIKA